MEAAGYRYPDLLISLPATGQPVAERGLTGRRSEISRDLAVLLVVFRDGMTLDELVAELASRGYAASVEEVGSAIRGLISAGLLCTDPKDAAYTGAARVLSDQAWGDQWQPAASRFHWSTRYDGGLTGLDDSVAPPDPPAAAVPVFQRYSDAPLVSLPSPARLPSVSFAQVLATRRTIRDFTPDSLSLAEVSQLLYYTHYPQHLVDAPPYGWLPRRPWANGGARGELELYVLARRVADLDPGLYHYQLPDHRLAWLGPDPGDSALKATCYGQDWCVTAPVTVFVTAVPRRCAAKYGTARAWRVILFDAGCLLQTFSNVATALALGPYVVAAFCDGTAEEIIGLDGVHETLLLLLGAGHPAMPAKAEKCIPCNPGLALPPGLVEDVYACRS